MMSEDRPIRVEFREMPMQGVLASGEHVQKVLQSAQAFAENLKTWVLHRNNPQSPLLHADTIQMLVDGFLDQIKAFNDASELPMPKWTKRLPMQAEPSSRLYQKLIHCEQMRDYDGNREEAAMQLTGAMIKCATTLAEELQLPFMSVDHDLVKPPPPNNERK
jgi:hypothetical protein